MSKEQVERSEQTMFENFLDKIYDECKLSELSYFERNLEVICCLSKKLVQSVLSSFRQENENFLVLIDCKVERTSCLECKLATQ